MAMGRVTSKVWFFGPLFCMKIHNEKKVTVHELPKNVD